MFSLFTKSFLFLRQVSPFWPRPWSPFDNCHILGVFAVPVVTQPVLSAFVMAAALGLLRVRRAGRLRSDEPLEKTAHRLLCEWRRCRHVLRQTINLLLEKDSKFSIVSIEYRVIWRNLLLIYNRPTVLGIPTTWVLWNQFREKAPDLCINYFILSRGASRLGIADRQTLALRRVPK